MRIASLLRGLLCLAFFSSVAASASAQSMGYGMNTPYSPSRLANYTASNLAPAAPTSTTFFTMQGLAGSITPTTTGRVLVTVSGSTQNGTLTGSGNGIRLQISHGTGSAPANGATLTGTQDATYQTLETAETVTTNISVTPFATTWIITGLTVGTTYWIDLAAEAIGTTGYSAVRINLVAQEL